MGLVRGNLNYDPSGSVGFADLILVAKLYGDTTGLASGTVGGGVLTLAWQGEATADTPEPASAALVVSAGLLLGRRRR